MWGLNDLTGPTWQLPGQARGARSCTSKHANTAGGCCQGLSLFATQGGCYGIHLGFACERCGSRSSAWSPWIPPTPPHLLWGWGGRGECCPGVGKVGTPTPYKKAGICLSRELNCKVQDEQPTPCFLHRCLSSSCPSWRCAWTDSRSWCVPSSELFFSETAYMNHR